MRIKINRCIIDVFEGAEVKHALLSYLARRRMSVKLVDKLVVTDIWGHEIDQGAPVSQHKEIRVKFKE